MCKSICNRKGCCLQYVNDKRNYNFNSKLPHKEMKIKMKPILSNSESNKTCSLTSTVIPNNSIKKSQSNLLNAEDVVWKISMSEVKELLEKE